MLTATPGFSLISTNVQKEIKVDKKVTAVTAAVGSVIYPALPLSSETTRGRVPILFPAR